MDQAMNPTLTATSDIQAILEGECFGLAELARLRALVLASMTNRNRLRETLLGWETFASGISNKTLAGIKEGVGYWLLGDNERAAEILDRHRRNVVGGYVLGRCWMNLGDPAKAQAAFDAASEADGHAVEPIVGGIEARQAQDRHEDTDRLMERIRMVAGDGAEVHYQRGTAAFFQGDYGVAREQLEKAVEMDPEHPGANFRLAFLLDRDGLDDDALRFYERARRTVPTFINAFLNLGILYEDLGQWDRARVCYEEILKTNPNHPRARLYLEDVRASMDQFYDRDQERRADRRNQILRTPVTDFELSVRSRNCLNKMNITCLGDLIKKTEPELLSYKNFGETSLQEIKDMLSQKGLRLGMGTAEIDVERPVVAMPGTVRRVSLAPEGGDALAKPISELEFSVRARKCMDRLGIGVVGDLVNRSEQDLLATKNFGQTSLQEVKQKLAELGLRLKER